MPRCLACHVTATKYEFEINFSNNTQNTEIRFVAKFGENRPLRSCQQIVWVATQKQTRAPRDSFAPILPKIGRSRPKFYERCHPFTCLYTEFGPVRLRFAGLIPERLIFNPKSQYYIGFQHRDTRYRIELYKCLVRIKM